MTIFARRRIQAMLNELAPHLSGEKGKALLRCLNDKKRVEQALPAEMELALLWAISTLGDIEIEPEWWGDNKRPDAITDNLVSGKTAAIEIASTNDNSLSGEAEMDAIALQIGAVAHAARKGSGQFLRYTFRDEYGYRNGQYFRRRMAPRGFKLDHNLSARVTNWIKSGRAANERLHLTAPGLEVWIEHANYKQVRFHNISPSTLAEAHSLDDNPLFDLLRRKRRQLKAAAPSTLRLIFLADVGSTLLRRIGQIGETDRSQRRFSGSEIITHFVQVYGADIDAVVTFSPTVELRQSYGLMANRRSPRRWTTTYFGAAALQEPPAALKQIAEALPAPHYEGYQARSLFRQGSFAPEGRGQYLGVTVTSSTRDDNHVSIKFPARLLLDLLAGRISEERFRAYLTNSGRNTNLFAHWLSLGWTINGAEMAPRCEDEDDDHLILHFSDDPAARPFRLEEG